MFKNCRIAGIGINSENYHNQAAIRGTPEYVMSPSALKKFASGPQEWVETGRAIAKIKDRLSKSNEEEEIAYLKDRLAELEDTTQAKEWGKLVDCRLLTPEDFDKRYIVRPSTLPEMVLKCPSCGSVTEAKKCRSCGVERVETEVQTPWSSKSDLCKEWTQEQQKAGLEPVSRWAMERCDEAVARILSNPIIKKCIECSQKQVHVVGEWHDKATGLVIPVQCLMDLVPRTDTEFVPGVENNWPTLAADLKTCSVVDDVGVSKKTNAFGWHIQAAFDLDLLNAAAGTERTDWLIIGQRNFGIYQPFAKLMGQDFITLGRAAYRRSLENYAWCLKNNRFPGPDDTDQSIMGMGILVPSQWMAMDEQFAPKFSYDDGAGVESEAPPMDGDIFN